MTSNDEYTPEERAHHLREDLGPSFMNVFNDDDITELGVNPRSETVWADSRTDGFVSTDVELLDATVSQFLYRLAGFTGNTIQSQQPVLECSLPQPVWGGGRLSAAVPPTVAGPAFSLRKFEEERIPLESYVEDEIMSQHQYDRLIHAIKHHENIAVVGGTNSGKTTLLMSILNKMGRLFPGERFVTIEDTPELSLETAWNRFSFYTFESGDSYRGTIKSLVHLSLRHSPDRLIVGECRGPGITDVFEAFLSGHPGAFTYHASSISRFFRRVMTNCRRASDTEAHKYAIGDAIDLIVILEKARGIRFVKQMAEVDRFDDDAEHYVLDQVHRDPTHPQDRYVPDKVYETRESATTN